MLRQAGYGSLSIGTFANQPGVVRPVKTGIQFFQQVTGFPLARERRKAKVLLVWRSQAICGDL
jgi:hypothetical protein